MEGDRGDSNNRKLNRAARVFTPFVILLAALLILNTVVVDDALPRQAVDAATKIVDLPAQEPVQTPVPQDSGQPIPTAILYATASVQQEEPAPSTPVPTRPAEAVAIIYGPPAAASFAISAPLSFYWRPGAELPENYTYGLHIANAEEDRLVGVVSEPNLGTGFQVHLNPLDFGLAAGDYLWDVRLVQQPEGIYLGSAGRRPLRLVGEEQ